MVSSASGQATIARYQYPRAFVRFLGFSVFPRVPDTWGIHSSTRRHTSVLPRAAALARIGCRVGAIGLDGHQYQRASAESDYADHNQNDDDEHPHSGRTFLLNDDRYGLLGGLNCRASRHLGRLWRGCFRAPPKLIGIPPSNLIAFVDIRRDIRGPFMLKRQVLDT